MKKSLQPFLILFLFLSFLLGPLSFTAFSQYGVYSARLNWVDKNLLKPDETSQRLEELIKNNKKMAALRNELINKGYQPQTESKNFLGTEDIFLNENKERVIIKVYVQDYIKPESDNTAALASVSISVGSDSFIYPFYIIATEGNFKKGREYSVDDDLEIYKENRWLSCVRNYFQQRCVASNICILYTRSETWASYLLNIAYTSRRTFALGSAFCIALIQ